MMSMNDLYNALDEINTALHIGIPIIVIELGFRLRGFAHAS